MPISDRDASGSRDRSTSARLTRRALLGGAIAATAGALACPAAAQPSARVSAKRGPPIVCEEPAALQWPTGMSEHRLGLRHVTTGESFDGVIRPGGRFDAETLARLDALMRDTQSGTVGRCDARLFDLLACLQAHVQKPFYIISGFRTRESNDALGRNDASVARNSFHIRGMAADIYVEGAQPRELAQKAREVGAGGVGTGATFIHLDVGPARSWTYDG